MSNPATLSCAHNSVKCDVCGRPVIRRVGRGSKKFRHRDCTNMIARENQVEKLYTNAVWGDLDHISKRRKRLFQIICYCFNQKGTLIFRPDDPREPELILAEIKAQEQKNHDIQENRQEG